MRLRGAYASVAVRGVSGALAALSGVVLARHLGPESYGVYAFAFALAQVIALPALMGVPDVVLREAARKGAQGDWAAVNGVLSWGFLTAIGSALQECIKTNVGGAENVISAAIDCGVERVVAGSTDKSGPCDANGPRCVNSEYSQLRAGPRRATVVQCAKSFAPRR